jgi:hypothetical protein
MMMRDDGYLSLSDSALIKLATVVDFPDPVVPTTAECLVISLLTSISAGIESAFEMWPIFTKYGRSGWP